MYLEHKPISRKDRTQVLDRHSGTEGLVWFLTTSLAELGAGACIFFGCKPEISHGSSSFEK
jgi:hypothetical protein